MKKKKIFLISICSFLGLLLIGFLIFLIMIFLTPKEKEEIKQPIFSPQETIQVDISHNEIAYFEDFSFLGKDVSSIQKHFSNVMYVNDTNIKMKNIIFFGIYGDFNLTISNGKVKNASFVSRNISSAEDTVDTFNAINDAYTQKHKLTTVTPIILNDNGEEKPFSSATNLYDTTNHLLVSYNDKNYKTKIISKSANDIYNIEFSIV